ncbi:MAG: hypothetical protein ACJ72W_10485 [Actinoallomurus sp.]
MTTNVPQPWRYRRLLVGAFALGAIVIAMWTAALAVYVSPEERQVDWKLLRTLRSSCRPATIRTSP